MRSLECHTQRNGCGRKIGAATSMKHYQPLSRGTWPTTQLADSVFGKAMLARSYLGSRRHPACRPTGQSRLETDLNPG